MKSLAAFIVAILSALMIACQDDKQSTDLFLVYLPGDTTNGQMSAIKSQTEWVASAYAAFHNDDRNFISITAATFTREGYEREHLALSYLPTSTGFYSIDRVYQYQTDKSVKAIYATSTADGDASEDFYRLDTAVTDNYIEITKMDTVSNEIEGFFTCSFVLTTHGGKQNPLNPDRVRFWNGHFKVKITN